MENNLNWDLTEIFQNEEALEEAINELYSYLDKIIQYKGK